MYDVNADGLVTPLDALLVIIEINALGPHGLTVLPGGTAPPLFLDVSGDDFLGSLDALLVINYLNAGGAGEGEAGHIERPPVRRIRPAIGPLSGSGETGIATTRTRSTTCWSVSARPLIPATSSPSNSGLRLAAVVHLAATLAAAKSSTIRTGQPSGSP